MRRDNALTSANATRRSPTLRAPVVPRRLTSVVCLFEDEVVPLPLDRVPVGRITRGHRFLSRGEISVANVAEYLERLGEARVVLDHERRKEIIRKDLEAAAADKRFVLKPDPGLL